MHYSFDWRKVFVSGVGGYCAGVQGGGSRKESEVNSKSIFYPLLFLNILKYHLRYEEWLTHQMPKKKNMPTRGQRVIFSQILMFVILKITHFSFFLSFFLFFFFFFIITTCSVMRWWWLGWWRVATSRKEQTQSSHLTMLLLADTFYVRFSKTINYTFLKLFNETTNILAKLCSVQGTWKEVFGR